MSDVDKILRNELRNLPPLPESVIRIHHICQDDQAGINDLVDIVESDPLLTANLLRQANSAYYGFQSKINTVAHAISLFGMSTVLGFAVSSAARNSFKIDLSPYGITEKQFSDVAQKRFSLLYHWTGRLPELDTDNLLPAIFLADIGEIIVARVVKHNKQAEAFRHQVAEGEPVDVIEKQYAGSSAREITARMLEEWKLNPIIINIIKESSSNSSDMDINAAAAAIATAAIRFDNTIDEASIDAAIHLVSLSQMDTAIFHQAIACLIEE
jgi:HD-like signal output (HDOD) protein